MTSTTPVSNANIPSPVLVNHEAADKSPPTKKASSRGVGDFALLPVEGFERSSGSMQLQVDVDGIRQRLSQALHKQGGDAQAAILAEIDTLVPQIEAFLSQLHATPALTLLDQFIGQLETTGRTAEANKLQKMTGEEREWVANGLKNSMLDGTEAHLSEVQAWQAQTTEERKALMGSAAKQWGHVLKNAWAPEKGQVLPDAIATLLRAEDWKDISNVQKGARYGNLGDLLASSVGVAHALASGNHADLVRLLITGSGVTGGYINDKGWGMKLEDPDAAERSNLGKAVRPLQHPDRAGFLAYLPAALAFLGSGVYRNLSSEAATEILGQSVSMAGVPDIIGGASLAAGFASVIMLNDPRTGEVVQSIPGDQIEPDPKTGIWLDARTQEPAIPPGMVPDLRVTDKNTGKEHHISLPKYLRIPEAVRPELKEVLLRKPVLTDRLNQAKNWVTDVKTAAVEGGSIQSLKFQSADSQVVGSQVDPELVAKGRDWGRFQVFAALSSLTTGMGWFALADRGGSLVANFSEVAMGLAQGPSSPQFWSSVMQVGTVALTAAMAYVYTKTNLAFARAGAEDKAREEEALNHGHLDFHAYEAARERKEVPSVQSDHPSAGPNREPPMEGRWEMKDGKLVQKWMPNPAAGAGLKPAPA